MHRLLTIDRLILSVILLTALSAGAHAQGTYGLVADIAPGTEGSQPEEFVALGGALYFLADSDLYRYADGAVSLAPGGAEIDNMDNAVALGDRLYFIDEYEFSEEVVYAYDPASGTVTPAADSGWEALGAIDLLIPMAGRLYFVEEDFVFEENDFDGAVFELDPTARTVRAVSAGGSSVEALFPLDGKLYYSGETDSGTTLFVYDPDDGTTTAIASNTVVEDAAALGGKLYFRERSPETGREVFVFDPETQTVSIAVDLVPGTEGSLPSEFTALGDRLYFSASTAEAGVEVFAYDPETEEATAVTDLTISGENTEVDRLTGSGGRLYFLRSAFAPFTSDLYVYDPASATTSLIADVSGPFEDTELVYLAGFEGRLFISTYTPETGYELYSYDPGDATNIEAGTPDSSGMSMHVSPNPAAGSTRVTFRLDRPSPVRISLLDALGRRVAHFVEREHVAGEHHMEVDVASLHLAPGIYLLRADALDTRATVAITILR